MILFTGDNGDNAYFSCRKQLVKQSLYILQLVSLEKRKEKGELELRGAEEPVVIDFTESDSGKKVRRRRINSNERVMRYTRKTDLRATNVGYMRDISFRRRNYSLVLYQEICV